MSTDNYEFGAFDRAVQQSIANKTVQHSQLILKTTAHYWLGR